MKNLFIYISLLIAATTIGYSLAPVTVVLNNDGDNLSVELNDYTSGTPVPLDTIGRRIIPTITPNGSGYSSFVVGEGDPDWGDISPADVNSSVILDIYDNGILIRQVRLDQLIERTAQSERLPTRVKVGKIIADSSAVFEQRVEIKGPLILSIGTFSSLFELDTLTTSNMIYNGSAQMLNVVESDFSSLLANGTTYTIVSNNSYGILNITLDNGGLVTLLNNKSTTIIKVGGKLYFVAKP